MIDAVAESIAFNFLMDGEGTIFFVVVELHLRGVETGFAFNEVADGGVFDNHFRPERVAGKAEEIVSGIGRDFNDDVSPAG